MQDHSALGPASSHTITQLSEAGGGCSHQCLGLSRNTTVIRNYLFPLAISYILIEYCAWTLGLAWTDSSTSVFQSEKSWGAYHHVNEKNSSSGFAGTNLKLQGYNVAYHKPNAGVPELGYLCVTLQPAVYLISVCSCVKNSMTQSKETLITTAKELVPRKARICCSL